MLKFEELTPAEMYGRLACWEQFELRWRSDL